MNHILVLYYSRTGSVRAMAQLIGEGIERTGAEARLRTVPPMDQPDAGAIPRDGDLYCTADDLRHCSGLALGSPTRFGTMAAPLKHFLDQTGDIWLSGDLIGRPATVFTSTATLHGGQEATLLGMILPLLHHGMLIAGVPYSVRAITRTTSGGTPYGASHHAGQTGKGLTEDETDALLAQGERLGKLAHQLAR